MKNLDGLNITLVAKPSDTIGNVKTKLHQDDRVQAKLPEGTTADELRIVFKGKQLDNDTTTLSGYEVGPLDTVHLLLRLRGGAKKGAKKTISKGERMAGLRAKAMYMGTSVTDQATTTLMNQVSAAGYTTWALTQMNFAQMQQLCDTAYNIQRGDKVAEGVEHLLVPQLQTMIDRKTALEKEIQSARAAFNVGFCEAFTNDNGFDTDPFYNMVDSRLEQLQNQAVQEQINAGVQQGIQQVQTSQAASSSGAAPMQEN